MRTSPVRRGPPPEIVIACSLVRATLLIAFAAPMPVALEAQANCAVGAPLPAYAHNDYENDRPLYDALALGYVGVEADVHLVRDSLRVAHDWRDAPRAGTLRSLYLDPLEAWVRQCGRILSNGRPFLLNVELKTPGMRAYRALVRLLTRYPGLVTVVREGLEIPGPVTVTLVGWQPPLDSLAAERERVVSVQWILTDKEATPPDAPADLIRLVTADYGKTIGWSGKGVPPIRARRVLAVLIAARDASPGRIARVHNVPLVAAVYRFVLEAGVDLIGTKDLIGTRALLAAIR